MVWCWVVRSGSWVVGRLGWVIFWILGNTFVFNIGNIPSISVDCISYNLGAAIRKSNAVLTVGSITITVLISSKSSL